MPSPAEDAEPRAVSVSILKGGVGKSTISVNLADRLAARGHDVLFIDLDPNGHASYGLGYESAYKGDLSIGDILLNGDDVTFGDVIYPTDFGFDVLPSSGSLEMVESKLKNVSFGDVRLRQRLVEPLLGDEYEYIVIDSPAYRGKLSDNGLVATQNMILPLTPERESLAGFKRTMERQIQPIREQIGLNILAITPNRLGSRIDQRTMDRKLVEDLNRNFPEHVPEYARITPEEFEKIDDGEIVPLPKPGIRNRSAVSEAFSEGKPLGQYAPENDQVECFDELARIVEVGGTNHD
ncbi:ParA family protein [Halobacteriales archaeon QS_8_69_26]|nr:MAG: ParA family protein [Halobacteriales archaeon QS_8_69_26]